MIMNVETKAVIQNQLAMINDLFWTEENHSESQHSLSPRRYSNSGFSTDNHYTTTRVNLYMTDRNRHNTYRTGSWWLPDP